MRHLNYSITMEDKGLVNALGETPIESSVPLGTKQTL